MVESVLSGADIGVVAVYFVAIIGIGIFASWRSNRGTVSGYFLAGRSMWFLPIGASLFVSNIGTEHFIGLAGSGAGSGISVGAWEFNALFMLQLLGWLFIPVYIACGTYTMPEYLSKRFGGSRLRVYFAFASLVLYIFTKCSGDLYTGALFIQQSLKWDLYLSIVILVLITATLTLTGGLTAVIYTDTLQAFLMVGGALYLMGAGFAKIGGFSGLLEKYPQAVPTNVSYIVPNTTCHHPDKQAFRMLRPVDDDYMPWLGFLVGQTPGSIWYWCADQVIVQRLLAAKNLAHAQGASLMAGFIKILPMFMMVMPGMISRILYPNEVACTNPDMCYEICQSRAGCTSIAYPKLVLGLMPSGAKGLMMAVMIAALMSDLDSIFNSASTLFTIDIWKRFRKAASVTEMMIVGRVFIVVMVGISIAWVPVIKETQGGQVFIYIQEVTNYIAPPFAAIFLLAVLVPRVNETGAFWSLMFAFLIGVVRLFIAFMFQGENICGVKDTYPLPPIIKNFHYMYFSMFITGTTAILAVIISYCTERPDPKFIHRTTYWTKDDPEFICEVTEFGSELKDIPIKKENCADITGDDITGSDKTDVDIDEKPVYTEPNDSGETKTLKKMSLGRRIVNIVLGIKTDQESHTEDRTLQEHLASIADLKQTKLQTIFLSVALITLMIIGVSMYIFWSVYDFDHAPFYPTGSTNDTLLPGDVRPPLML